MSIELHETHKNRLKYLDIDEVAKVSEEAKDEPNRELFEHKLLWERTC